MTPLHWACETGADKSIYFLLAWTKDLNKTDNSGMTALHRGVLSQIKFAHFRSMMEMLIKGASRDIRDANGNRPIDLIDPTTPQIQKNELIKILGKQPITIPCSQVTTPIKKITRSYLTFSVYVFLVASTFIEMHLFVFPYQPFSDWLFWLNLHFLFTNIFFLMASFKNPGYIDKDPELSFEKLVERIDPDGLCPTCETVFTSSSRHCYVCNRCINKFDHHCNWINNCVGKDNHFVFYTYILSLLLYFIHLMIMFTKNEGLSVELESTYNYD